MTKKQRKMLYRIITAFVLMVVLSFVPLNGLFRFAFYMVPYFIIGYDILKKALKGIINRQVFDENFLMAIATVGAIIIALSGSGDYTEAVAVMLFYQIGELFQSYAVGKSRKNICELMDIRPDYANLEQDGNLIKVSPDEVEAGSIIAVFPGEKVPIDGIITDGTTSMDTVMLTGESVPKDVTVGDEIVSGSVNLTGFIKIRTTKEFGESTVSKILELVENASFRKSKSEDFIAKFAKIYTPAVCSVALALAFLPPLINVLMSNNADFSVWLYRALTFLVVSCPCALVISIPLSFFAGIGGASREGILVKGSNFLESLSKTECVVFDKTATLTKGVFEVSAVHHAESEEKLLEYAALAESASLHPISRSLACAYNGVIDTSRVENVNEITGMGVVATVDKKHVAVGNDKLMQKFEIEYKTCHHTGTVIHVAIDKEYAGHIVISDVIKATSKEAVSDLKRAGVKKVVMLTGDINTVAEKVAKELGIDEYESELLPDGKVEKIENLLSKMDKKAKLAFVGDGINDAPVLARSDIGIAMGMAGSDAAIEAADIVLMDDDPKKIAKAIKISKKCLGIVNQNTIFAITVKLLCLLFTAVGVANMWLAIFADVGVMVIAVINAIRALNVKKL